MNNVLDHSIFKAYDIRGVVDQGLTAETVINIGKAIGTYALSLKQQQITVGFDGRLSSPKLCEYLIQGLTSTGINVINIGLSTSPILYFSTYELKTNSGVMITGSHNPPAYNGFKIVIDQKALSADEIQHLKEIILEKKFTRGQGKVSEQNVIDAYKRKILSSVKLKRKMKIAIDCGNGAAGIVAESLFRSLGAHIYPIFCEVDGTFPNHHPDPSRPENLKDLAKVLQDTDAEIGIAFDGDGDRLGVVTKDGEIIYPDRQLMLFAENILKTDPESNIIFDVKSSRHLFAWIKKNKGNPVIWKTGHSFIKNKMREMNSPLAGEMSGHTFFNDRWFGFDDGVYAGARLLEILSYEENANQKLKALPKDISTPEINIAVNEGQQHQIISQLQQSHHFPQAQEVIMIDGLRVEYPFGFGLVRASNTTPVLVLRFEATSEEYLKIIQEEFIENLTGKVEASKINFQ